MHEKLREPGEPQRPPAEGMDQFEKDQIARGNALMKKDTNDPLYQKILCEEMQTAVKDLAACKKSQTYDVFPEPEAALASAIQHIANRFGKDVKEIQEIYTTGGLGEAPQSEKGKILQALHHEIHKTVTNARETEFAIKRVLNLRDYLAHQHFLGDPNQLLGKAVEETGVRLGIPADFLREYLTQPEKLLEEPRRSNEEIVAIVDGVFNQFYEMEDANQLNQLEVDGIENIQTLIEKANVSDAQKEQWRTIIRDLPIELKDRKDVKIIALLGGSGLDTSGEAELIEKTGVRTVFLDNLKISPEEYLRRMEKEMADPTCNLVIQYVSSHGINEARENANVQLNSADDYFSIINDSTPDANIPTSEEMAQKKITTQEMYEAQKIALQTMSTPPEIVHVFDACHSGTATNKNSPLFSDPNTKAVLAASSEDQESYQGKNRGYYMEKFFQYLSEGMSLGEAHVRADMFIHMTDRGKHVYDNPFIPNIPSRQNPRAAVRKPNGVIERVSKVNRPRGSNDALAA